MSGADDEGVGVGELVPVGAEHVGQRCVDERRGVGLTTCGKPVDASTFGVVQVPEASITARASNSSPSARRTTNGVSAHPVVRTRSIPSREIASFMTPALGVRTVDLAALPDLRQRARELVPTLKALADEHRLAIVLLLASSPHTVRELADATGLSQTLVSHHLAALREAELVTSTPRGRANVYQLCCEELAAPSNSSPPSPPKAHEPAAPAKHTRSWCAVGPATAHRSRMRWTSEPIHDRDHDHATPHVVACRLRRVLVILCATQITS